MKINRVFTEAGKNPFSYFQMADFAVANPAEPDKTVLISAPKDWSLNAVEILYSKYCRKAGVPVETKVMYEDSVPLWLCRSENYNAPGVMTIGEKSAQQVIGRIVGHWTYAGWKNRYFTTEEDACAFHEELIYAMCAQMVAPNSPQWFNTGLWWAYGIEGDTINWRWGDFIGGPNGVYGDARQITREEAYKHPQTSACFIQSIDDSLIGPGGILDALKAEASIFKYGSGSGINFSSLRPKGSPLSGGGKSSGLMSFLKVFDANAGSIKSGGTTRRAAKMVVVDADHGEALDFVTWKAREELKVVAMTEGSQELVARSAEHQDLYGNPLYDGPDIKLLQSLTTKFESEAYNTVSGQNSNNSLRVTDEFMQKVEDARDKGTLDDGDLPPNLELFEALCISTWKAGDPGMQFHDACNKWHTIPKHSPQRATNPCSEYSFIDDSACNLASINLHKFKVGHDDFDAKKFAHLAYIMTIALDITVEMSSYPSAKIAENSWKYRPLGLGYANLGGLLMSMGIPYGSARGQILAGAITNLMHVAAWRASSDMAAELGAFYDYEAHRADVSKVRTLHCQANDCLKDIIFNDDIVGCIRDIALIAHETWKPVVMLAGFGIRNAQLTLLAPTGTIGLLMDCATTGIEPDFALIKHKKRAGGGSMTIVNPLVGEGMLALGYTQGAVDEVAAVFADNGDMSGVVDSKDIEVFACANDISWQHHLEMMASVQPFLSGAISKTVNLPNSATVKDVADCYIMAWKLGLKAVAPYRDGSKGAQPLTAKKKEPAMSVGALGELIRAKQEELEATVPGFKEIGAIAPGHTDLMISPEEIDLALEKELTKEETQELAQWMQGMSTKREHLATGGRKKLPHKRRGFTAKAKIEGRSIYLRTGEYEDGTLGEVFLNMDREGSLTSLALNALAIAMSMGLQYGVPLDEYIDAFQDMSGGPMGSVAGPDEVRFCSSVVDWVVRLLKVAYLTPKIKGRTADVIIVDDVVAMVPPKSYDARDPLRFKSWDVKPKRWNSYLDEACSNCGEKRLTRNGTCKVCQSCGTTTGCS